MTPFEDMPFDGKLIFPRSYNRVLSLFIPGNDAFFMGFFYHAKPDRERVNYEYFRIGLGSTFETVAMTIAQSALGGSRGHGRDLRSGMGGELKCEDFNPLIAAALIQLGMDDANISSKELK